MRVFRRGVPAVLVILLSVLFLKGSTINVPTGIWQSASNMSTARANAVAVLVPDGRIVIAGGADSTGAPTASAEAFSADGTFSALPAMSAARARHAAIYTMTGDLLVTGGVTSGGGFTNTAEAFDSLTNTWHPLSANMVESRAGHTMSQLQNGNVLIAGGENSSGPVAALEIYDITSGQFSFAGTLATARKGQAAAVVNDGRVLIIGGTTVQSDGTSATLASTEIYDPATGQVTAGPTLATPRTNATATTLLDGRVLVLGGSYPEGANGNAPELASAEIFDPVSNTFTASASHLATARTGHLAFLLPNNNNVLILGGTNSQPDASGTSLLSTPLASAELYTPWTDSFATTQPMSTARDAATGSALNNTYGFGTDGLLLMSGGTNMNSAEVYGFATVKTDAPEYVPGAPVVITGSGWVPGETVQLTLAESPNVDSHGPLTAIADANGNIYNDQFSPDANDAGITFLLTAKASNSQAQVLFKDANKIGSVTATPSDPPEITAGTAQNYNVTVNRATGNGTTGNFTANITVSGLPSGATENPALSITLSSQQNSNSGTLTITTTTAVAAGSYTLTITATNPAVSGDSQSTTVKLNVKNTATSLTVGAASGVFGGTASLAATLKDASNNPILNETITFTLNGASAGTGTTNVNGVASVSASLVGINVGNYSAGTNSGVAASFAGDGSFAPSNGSNSLAVTQADTTTTVASSANPSIFGQSVTFTATVTPVAPGSGTRTGTVTFKDGATTLGTGTVNASGIATFSTSALNVATHSVTAEYGGDTNFGGSTSAPVSQVVNKADTTTSLSSNVNPSVFGQSVTFTATVSPVSPGAGTPTGTVNFMDGVNVLGSGTLNGSGVATFSTSTLNVASHSITAVYADDTNFNGSTSSALTQVVNKADTSTTLVSSVNPSVFGQSITFTATVSAVAPGVGTATGTVTFKDGGTVLGTGTLSGGDPPPGN